MDASAVIAFPGTVGDATVDDLDQEGDSIESWRVLAEIDAAIALVAGGAARRVRLTGLPFVDDVAGVGLAHARAEGVGFAIERTASAGGATVTVGPLA
jgi:hypothetical protein